MLAQPRMMSGQLLVDFLQAVETEVMQGSRDYPHDISDIEGLLRRTFTSGLPGWLCRQLTLLDFLITNRMVEKSQVAWDATVRVKPFLHLVSNFFHTTTHYSLSYHGPRLATSCWP